MAFGALIDVGAGSVLSIALGAQDKKTEGKLFGCVNRLLLICTIIYIVVALIFSTQLIRIMGGEGETLALGDSYFRVTIFGAFFWVYGLAGNMIVRAEGKMKTAAYISA